MLHILLWVLLGIIAILIVVLIAVIRVFGGLGLFVVDVTKGIVKGYSDR